MAVPQMREIFDSRPIQHGKTRVRLVGLLGRDFLRHGRLIYDGALGRFEVRMNLYTLPKG